MAADLKDPHCRGFRAEEVSSDRPLRQIE